MNIKAQKGVSLITVVITIVVIIIISAITIQSSSEIPDEAHYTKYKQTMKNVQTGVDEAKIKNAQKGTTEEKLTAGFKKVILENAPAKFVSFGAYDEEITGYIVDLEKINYLEAEYGKAYTEYESGDKVKFGAKESDVYVFDSEWTVYYVRGLDYNDSKNYTLD